VHKTLNPVGLQTASRFLLIVPLLLCGCEKVDTVSKYTVPKHESLQTTEFLAEYERTHPKPEQMIGVVLPKEGQLWFFKVQGNTKAVNDREGSIREFLKTLSFSPQGKPDWKLPEGWTQLPTPGNESRYATLILEGSPSLELTVTSLSSRPDLSAPEQVVMNINRWRGQLSLPPIDEVDLDRYAEKIPVGENTGYFISINGRPKPKPQGMAGMPGMQTRPQAKTEQADPAAKLAYNKPDTWTEGPPTQFAALSFRVSVGDQQAVITLTSAGGNKLLNVNRWRGQVGLEPLDEDELNSTAQKVEVGSLTGNLYEMMSNGRAILGVIVEDGGHMWFVKIMGDMQLVQRERDRFNGFLKSLQLK
jgi:hypothetical protein